MEVRHRGVAPDGLPAPARPDISVCVATYKRPEQLRRLLATLLAQRTGGLFTFEIAVADNDAAATARAVVREYEARDCHVAYAVEPAQNISLARNKALSLARGRFIATTDDDLYVADGWLFALFQAAATFGADVVHGPVLPIFPEPCPFYVREFHAFNRPNPPTGAGAGYVFTTANALFRADLVASPGTAFDPALGQTGGEDTVFFNGLRSRGAKMIWCREALVYGRVAPERATLRWLLRRQYRNGTQRDRLAAASGSGARRPSVARILVTVVAAMAGGLVLWLRGLVQRSYREAGARKVVSAALSFAHLAGVVAALAGGEYREYRGRKSPSSA